jgi:molecular chaperone GrpE (heat shock protein)
MTRAVSLAQLAQHARESLHGLLGSPTPRQDLEAAVGAEPEADENLDVAVAPAGAPADLAGLEKQIARLGREQFKLSSLIEMQQQNVHTALEQLREQDARREQERATWTTQREADRAEARLELIQRLLPALDGLDNALSSGEQLLRRLPPHTQSPASPSPASPVHTGRAAWYGGLIAWPVVVTGLILRRPARPSRPASTAADEWAAWQDSYAAWLRGLELVRERCLVTLAAEGVRPIEAVGQPFEPNFHVAVDTTPAAADVLSGTVVAELRRGYAVGARVLRYAEVVVARTVEPQSVQEIVPQEEKQPEI